MDRATASEAVGREFEPHRARHVFDGFFSAPSVCTFYFHSNPSQLLLAHRVSLCGLMQFGADREGRGQDGVVIHLTTDRISVSGGGFRRGSGGGIVGSGSPGTG